MYTNFILPARLAFLISLMGGLSSFSAAQILTPGAAAIGGTTTDAPLIAPGGQSVQGTVLPTAPLIEGEAPRTLHLPDPNWEIILPPKRGNRGGTQTASASSQTISSQPATSNQTTQSIATETATASATTVNTPSTSATGTSTAGTDNATTEVTAGTAQTPATPATEAGVEGVSQPAVGAAASFDQIALNFGSENIDLTTQHEIALEPVLSLMRANPLASLRIAAVLALAEANDETAKTLARRRILAVRRYLVGQGVNADNLSFVISANFATEPFANHVLIEQVGN